MGRTRATSGSLTGSYFIDSGTAELIADSDNPRAYMLLVNGVESSHIDLDDPRRLDFEYLRWMAAVITDAAEATGAEGLLHLGAAGCSLARHLIAVRPRSRHLAVDIDARLCELVREWFELPRAPALRLRIGEARAVTRTLPDASRTAIIRDVFAGATTPIALTTQEFTADVKRVLRPDGVYLLNCGDGPALQLVRSEIATLATCFSDLAVIADPSMLKGRRRGNVVIAAADHQIESSTLTRELLGGGVPAQFWDTARCLRFAVGHQPLRDD